MAVLLLTMASVIQGLLHAFDALVVRRRLRQYTDQQQDHSSVTTRKLMAERHLLEGWAKLVSSTVQALAYSALLVLIAGPLQFVGAMAVLIIRTIIGTSYFRTARTASLEFLATQEQENRARRELRRGNVRRDDGNLRAVMHDAGEAAYRRDTRVPCVGRQDGIAFLRDCRESADSCVSQRGRSNPRLVPHRLVHPEKSCDRSCLVDWTLHLDALPLAHCRFID